MQKNWILQRSTFCVLVSGNNIKCFYFAFYFYRYFFAQVKFGIFSTLGAFQCLAGVADALTISQDTIQSSHTSLYLAFLTVNLGVLYAIQNGVLTEINGYEEIDSSWYITFTNTLLVSSVTQNVENFSKNGIISPKSSRSNSINSSSRNIRSSTLYCSLVKRVKEINTEPLIAQWQYELTKANTKNNKNIKKQLKKIHCFLRISFYSSFLQKLWQVRN